MKAIIISNANFPPTDAHSVRMHSIGLLLTSSGYSVTIIGINNKCKKMSINNCDGLEYITVNSSINKQKFIKTYINKRDIPDIIITIRSEPLDTLYYIIKYAKQNSVQLYSDSVEWYSHCEIASIIGLVQYLKTELMNRVILHHNFRIISISSYLDSYYKMHNIPSYRLPICMDTTKFDIVKPLSDEMLKITYAGSPVKKDYLHVIVYAIKTLTPNERDKIDFTLLGVNINELAKYSKMSTEDIMDLRCIHPKGRVDIDIVLKKLADTDFTILIRPAKERYTKAGFPTKSVESLMSSTPLICNMTSDLGMYLKDGYDCIEVKDESPEEIAKALRRALSLTLEQKDQMKKNAIKTAEKYFDYRLYVDEFGRFIRNDL